MADYLAILPEILLLVLAAILLILDLRFEKDEKGFMNWLTLVGLLATLLLTVVYGRPSGHEEIWGGTLRHDWLAFTFRIVFLTGAALTVVFSRGWEKLSESGSFYALLVFSTLGMTLMGAAGNLVMLFLSIETASIPLYVMAGFMTGDEKSTEGGFKYLLFGAMTSAVMLYGFSLMYGFSGTLDIYQITEGLMSNEVALVPMMGALLLVLFGFGFKVSMFPLQFWAPDVYQGAPTPVTGFLSTASKAAGFSVMVRVMLVAFPALSDNWQTLIAVISAITMTLGNLVAMRQSDIKRMLAYSSIAHAGYILMGLAAVSAFGLASMIYYIVTYLLTNLAAFGFVVVYYRQVGSDEIKDYAGMSRRSPFLAFGMLFTFLSLGGVPPLGGFFAKVLVFAAAVESGLVWLAVIGVLNAVVGLYYYLSVMKVVYLYRQEGDEVPLPVSRPHAVALGLCVLGVTFLGVVMVPMYQWATTAAQGLF